MNTVQTCLNSTLACRQAYKHNYFSYRWRVRDEFNTAIERLNYYMHLHGGDYRKTLLNERLLANYKRRHASCLKSGKLTELIQDTLNFLTEHREAGFEAMQSEIAYCDSMAQLIDNAFSILLSCSVEFNTLVGFSELYIAATEPEMIVSNQGSPKWNGKTAKRDAAGSEGTYRCRSGSSEFRGKSSTYTAEVSTEEGTGADMRMLDTIVSIRARVSTSFFSLVMQGDKNKIQFFLMPVEEIMGLSSLGSLRLPIAQFVAHLTEGEEVLWQLEGQGEAREMTRELLEETCIKFLKELIDATKAVMIKAG